MTLVDISRSLSERVASLRFADPVCCVYNPLDYAREPHELYLSRYGGGTKEVLLLGMNPGPFGMVQTGVPFGDVAMVRDWLDVVGTVAKPRDEHPKRPVLGFECRRSEVSGARLWGWARDRFGTPQRFFERFFVANYCPLAFMESGGANRTPDKLPAAEQQAVSSACDEALRAIVRQLEPRIVVGVGGFAERRGARRARRRECRDRHDSSPEPREPARESRLGSQDRAAIEELGHRAVTRTYTSIWTFKVHPEHVEAFRRHYGEGGSWVQLFRRARGYLGTQLLEDRADPLRFMTIDAWRSVQDYEAFRASYASEYAALDALCEGLTSDETLIGHFTAER